jgi:hypothetical protein
MFAHRCRHARDFHLKTIPLRDMEACIRISAGFAGAVVLGIDANMEIDHDRGNKKSPSCEGLRLLLRDNFPLAAIRHYLQEVGT